MNCIRKIGLLSNRNKQPLTSAQASRSGLVASSMPEMSNDATTGFWLYGVTRTKRLDLPNIDLMKGIDLRPRQSLKTLLSVDTFIETVRDFSLSMLTTFHSQRLNNY